MEPKKNSDADLEHLRPALIVKGIVIGLAVTLMLWEVKQFTKSLVLDTSGDVEMVEEEMVAVYTPPPPPQQAPPPPQLDVIEIVEDEEDVVETLEIMDFDIDEEIPIFEDVQEEAVAEEIFTVVEQMPEFPGGNEALMNFLNDNLKYPSIARENNIQGKVYVEFTVTKSGKLEDISLKDDYDIGGGCGKEALRVVKMMPDWNPGEQRGVSVNVRMILPVTFKLKNS